MFKKISKKLSNMRNALSVKTYKTPRLFVILMMVGINVVILLIAALIVLIIDDTYTNFIDAFALGSVTWMLAPNAILDIENPQTLFLAVLVLIVGLVLFSGTIIALTTNTIRDYFDKKKTSSGKIYIEKHVIILNWNNKVPELIADLVHVKSRKVTVLLLADIDKNFAERRIKNALIKKQGKAASLSNLNVLVKSADPLNQTELQDASIEKCDNIIIMNPEKTLNEKMAINQSDLFVIKIILSLGHLDLRDDIPIVAEVKALDTKEKIRTLNHEVTSLSNYRLLPICFDRRLGQIMAQTIIQKHMEDIYLSLFSFEGSEIYVLENTTMETCLNQHTHAIPIEEEKDYLYVLAPDNLAKEHKTSAPFIKEEKLEVNPLDEQVDRSVYIVGTNNKRQFIEETFKAYETLYHSKFKAHMVNDDDIEILVENLNATDEAATILLLSDEAQPNDAMDANVLNNLLYLKRFLSRKGINIIVELLDPKNDPLIKDFKIENTIISNKIISLLLSKLALFPRTEKFYDDLLTIMPHEDGKDAQAISVKQVTAVFKEGPPQTFANVKSLVASLYHAYDKKVIPIGIIRNDKVQIFTGELHKTLFTLNPDDYLIFMKL